MLPIPGFAKPNRIGWSVLLFLWQSKKPGNEGLTLAEEYRTRDPLALAAFAMKRRMEKVYKRTQFLFYKQATALKQCQPQQNKTDRRNA
jgi:hypothetical protein